jgi:hypothetical protein
MVRVVALANLHFVAGCSWQSAFLLPAFAVWSFCSRTCSRPSQTSGLCICRHAEQWNQRSNIWWVQQSISCVSEGSASLCDSTIKIIQWCYNCHILMRFLVPYYYANSLTHYVGIPTILKFNVTRVYFNLSRSVFQVVLIFVKLLSLLFWHSKAWMRTMHWQW